MSANHKSKPFRNDTYDTLIQLIISTKKEKLKLEKLMLKSALK